MFPAQNHDIQAATLFCLTWLPQKFSPRHATGYFDITPLLHDWRRAVVCSGVLLFRGEQSYDAGLQAEQLAMDTEALYPVVQTAIFIYFYF